MNVFMELPISSIGGTAVDKTAVPFENVESLLQKMKVETILEERLK